MPELLEKLVAAGAIMQVENEYRMQTREGSEWNQAYLEARNELLNDAGKLASERSQLLTIALQRGPEEVQARPRGEQGTAEDRPALRRRRRPQTDGSAIPVWVRDGWEVEEKTVLGDARAAGDSAAVVYGYIPKKMAEELKQAIAGYDAATTTLQTKGTPSGDEGIQARKAMETRQEQSQRTRDNLIDDILNETQVYLAGGDADRRDAARTRRSTTRQRCAWTGSIPCSTRPTHPDWHKVIDRAKKGDGDALEVVGHKGDPDKHPVCKAILDYVGSGKKGTEVRKQFGGAKYGWPQDAIDAALIVLVQRRGASRPAPGPSPSPRASSTRRTSPPPSSGSRRSRSRRSN